MTWVRLDDEFADNPKLERAGPLAAWLHVAGICYAARHLTDGVIPQAKAQRLAAVTAPTKQIQALLREGVWHQPGHTCTSSLCGNVPAGHYLIHDFLDYQKSKAQIDAEREADREKKRRQRATGAATPERGTDGRYTPRESPGVSRGDNNGTPPGNPTENPEGSPPLPVPSRPDPGDSRSQPTTVGTRPDPAGWQPPDQPPPDPPADLNALLTAAATILADDETARRTAHAELGNPTGYRNSRIGPLTRQNEPFWRHIHADNPDVTAQQLADATTERNRPTAPTGPQPDPLAAQQAALLAKAEAATAATRALAAEPPDPERLNRIAELKARRQPRPQETL